MVLPWLRRFFSRKSKNSPPRRKRRVFPQRFRPCLEALEDRTLFSVQALSMTYPSLFADSAGGPSLLASSRPATSADGRFAVFQSSAGNLVTNPGTNNGYQNIFVRDAQTGAVTLVSADPTGAGGNGNSLNPVISADGRFIAFQSDASDLVPNDTNGSADVFVRDLQTGTTTLVSANGAGASGDSDSLSPVISADGRFVAFQSFADDLVANDANGTEDVFVRDLQAGTTTLVSATPTGTSGNRSSSGPVISADGRFVAFQSNASDLVANDANNAQDVFVRDLQTGTTTLVSTTTTGASGNRSSSGPTISADGRYVAFQSNASNLVANDNNGTQDVFVRDLQAGTTTLVSATPTGASGNSTSQTAVISADGSTVAFVSFASNLVANDANGASDVFVRNLQTGATTLVSANAAGASANNSSLNPVISADGRYVAFQSTASDLVPGDANGTTDVFVRDLQTGTLSLASSTPSGTAGNSNSFGPAISADGQTVVFQSNANNLVPNDTNGTTDVFAFNLATAATTLVSQRDPALASFTGGGSSFLNTGSVSADGRYVAFVSFAGNLVPNDNNATSDVFVRDRQTGAIILVSANPSGASGNGASSNPVISADGRYVAFVSKASDLVPGDTNGTSDVFVRDLQTGTTVLVSATPAGASGNSDSSNPVISADGRYVAFVSNAGNLVPGDSNGASDVFVRDLQTGTTTLVSVNRSGTSGDNQSSSPVMSADGRYVAFVSFADDLVATDSNGTGDVFVRDLAAGTTTLVSAVASGDSGDRASSAPSISADGRFVAFQSFADNLVSNDANGTSDIFVRDLTTGALALVSANPSGAAGNSNSFTPVISADGRYVAFGSRAGDLVPGDTNGLSDVFVRDLQAGTTTLVSVTPGGTSGDNTSTTPAISADGRYVAFVSSADDLAPNDTNANQDVFLRDLQAGTTTLVSANPSGFSGNSDSSAPVLSADGQVLAFASNASDLVPGDYNGFQDVFAFGQTQLPTADPGGPYAIREGDSLTLDGSKSSNPGGGTLTYSWSINGHAGAAAGVNPTLTWAQLQALGIDDGPNTFTIALTVNDGHGGTAALATSLALSDAAPTGTFSASSAAVEGAPVTFSFANLFDPSQADTNAGFTYSYDFNNDGNFTDPGEFADVTSPTAAFTFAEEGTYTVVGRVKDKDGLYTDYTTTVTVADAALHAGTAAPTAVEGSAVANVLLATFTDDDPNATAANFSAAITWGDGDATAGYQIVADPKVKGQFDVIASKANPYTDEGPAPVGVAITDVGGATLSINTTLQVADAPLTITQVTPPAAVEGQALTNVILARFTDGNPSGKLGDFSATIDWGDGTTADAAGTVIDNHDGTFSVVGSHTYAEEGTGLTLTVKVMDAGGASQSASALVNVADAPLTISQLPAPAAVEGKALTNIVLARFTDGSASGKLGDYTATIDWGDGTTADAAGTLVDNHDGTFSVVGSHTYAEEGTGLKLSVKVTDVGGASQSAATTVNVAEAPIFALAQQPAISGFQNLATGPVLLATFGDAGGVESAAGEYQARIDWRDGTTSAGTVSISGNTIAVKGNHVYATAGTYHPLITLLDAGNSAAAQATIDVAASLTGQVRTSQSSARYDRRTKLYDQTLDVTNTGKAAIAGPIVILLTGLDTRIQLAGATWNGNPVTIGHTSSGVAYLTVNVSKLARQGSLRISLHFSNTLGRPIRYKPEVFAG